MKIWHVTNHYQPELGYEEYYTSLNQSLDNEITVLTSNLSVKSHHENKHIKLNDNNLENNLNLAIKRFHVNLKYSEFFISFSFLKYFFKAPRPDIIHFHTVSQGFTILGAIIALTRKIPYVIDNHDFLFDYHPLKIKKKNIRNIIIFLEYVLIRMPLSRFVVSKAKLIIAMNQACKDYLINNLKIKRSIFDGQLCVDTKFFYKTNKKINLNKNSFCFIGQLSKRKRIDLYLELLKLIDLDNQINNNFTFIFFLNTDTETQKVLINDFNIFKNIKVKFRFNLSPKKLSDHLNDIDALVMIANNSVVIPEVMAKSLYVIAANMQFNKIFNSYGSSFKKNSVKEALEKIKDFILDKKNKMKKAEEGSEFIIKKYSYNNYSLKLIEEYKKILSNG